MKPILTLFPSALAFLQKAKPARQLKSSFGVTLLLLFALAVSARAAQSTNSIQERAAGQIAVKPNIVFIIADDLGYGDLGCFGCKDIPTPNIDRLAREGVKFTDAYAYPVCSPTRAALLTGRYAEHNGVKGVLMGKDVPAFRDAVTLPQLLQTAGYTTGAVGKWHLGYTIPFTPTHMGFDEFFGFHGGKIDYFKHTDTAQKNGTPEGKHDLWQGDQEIFREGYSTDLFTTAARDFIREHATKPFFLYLAYNAPHYARREVFQAPEDYLKRFGAEGQTNGRGVYAAMVSCMDDGVGRVLDELKAQKLTDQTLVVFISDNGAEGAGSNGPLTGAKHQLNEGGIRVPWVARWPGVIPAGTVSHDVVHVIDLLPTTLGVAGAAVPKSLELDGINLWSAFLGNAAMPARPIYYGRRGIREGRWKLLDGKLYDLEKDLAERTDVSFEHPDVCARLVKKLQDFGSKK